MSDTTLSIRCSEEIKARFEEKKEKFGAKTYLEVLERLLDDNDKLESMELADTLDSLFDTNEFGLSKPERDIREEGKELEQNVVGNNNFLKKELMRKGYLAELRRSNTQSNNMEGLTIEELEKSTRRGSAFKRIERAIEILMENNDNATEQKDRVYISRNVVFEILNCNRQTLNNYFKQHETRIDDHNAKYNLTQFSNKSAKGEKVNFKERFPLT